MSDYPSIHRHETISTTSPLAISQWTACRRAVLLMFLFTLQASALEIPFDDLPALQGILPKKTIHYEIVDPVVVEGNSYTFKIQSPHGEYQVTSITKLLKTCHEIQVIEEYQHTEEGEQVWQGTKEGFKEMGQEPRQSSSTQENQARLSGLL